MPAGATLQFTAGGTIVAPDVNCSISYDSLTSNIVASSSDSYGVDLNQNWDDSGAAGNYYGNNGFRVITPGVPGMQSDVNNSCGQTIDMRTRTYWWADANRTVPLVGPVEPGSKVYASVDYFNDTPGVVADAAIRFYANSYATWWGQTYPFALGMLNIACTADSGATCPSGLPSTMKSGPFDTPQQLSSFPVGGHARIVYDFTVPTGVQANGPYQQCLTVDQKAAGLDQLAQASEINSMSGVTTEREPSNNSENLSVTVNFPTCYSGLAVTKTAAEPLVRRDGKTTWTVTMANDGQVPLDVPHLVDAMNYKIDPTAVVQSVDVTDCTTTGGATCPSTLPTGTPQKVLSDGTSTPLDQSVTTPDLQTAVMDLAWTNGPDTMPPGSSVTFTIVTTLSKPIALANEAIFDSGQGAANQFQTARSTASTMYAYSPALLVTKEVNPIKARPGQTVTFTVDVFNQGQAALQNVLVSDPVSQPLVATNPDGFTNVACRALTQGDLSLPSVTTVTPGVCPAITSDASGLSMTIPTLDALSGIRITYEAIAPMDARSAENIVTLISDPVYATPSNLSAHANLLTYKIGLSGTVWHDVDNSAGGTFTNIKTGAEVGTDTKSPGTDPGGLTVVLTNSADVVVATTAVNSDGTYAFPQVGFDSTYKVYVTDTDLAPQVGEVFATPIVPNGWANTTPLVRNVTTTDVDVTDQDFGVRLPASISGHVIHDRNYDSAVSTGDAPIENVTVELLDSNGDVIRTTMTDADGKYVFGNLPPGTYSVRQTQPAGYTDETLIVGTGATTAGGNGTANLFDSVVLSEGDNAVNYDFLEVKLYPVTITKFGLVNGTIGPIGGATFALYSTDPATAGATPVTDGVAADSAGAATFTSTGLRSGTDYWLVETQAPSGHQLLAQPVKFTVDDTGAITLANPSGLVKVDPDNASHLIVSDVIIPDMPLTGGNGPDAFLMLFALALIAGTVVARRRQLVG